MNQHEPGQIVIEDYDLYVAREALRRTIINFIISALDLVPLLGDAVSWSADALKLTRYMKGKLKKLDLTPDVSITVAWGTELLEFLALGGFPTHIIETLLQLRHDIPRMRRGFAPREARTQ